MVFTNSHKIVSISNFTKNQIIDLFDIDHNKIDVIYNGIDSKWFEKRWYQKLKIIYYGMVILILEKNRID